MYKILIKPLFDRTLALILLLLFAPILFILYLLLSVTMGFPVFFAQRRPGIDGKIFTIYKLRTMSDERDEDGELLSDEKRLNGIGKIVRSLSLDELPQLFNVLKGEMSFVGPRPLLIEYLELYSDEQKQRHNVIPGITGWAQVNGRNAISWVKKFELDVYYVKNQSFLLDMKILWLTFLKVVKRSDVSQDGHVTMEKFDGTN